MSRLASQADFFASYDAEGNKIPGTGNLYDEYRRFPFFAERANEIANRFPTSIGKIVVFGCGFGYLVDELVQRGFDAWGVEAADFARNKAAEVLPFASASRIVLANIANRAALNNVRAAAGLTGNARFALGISEDVLPVCTDAAEAQLALAECRRIISTTPGRFVHWITCTKPEDQAQQVQRLPGLLWLSRAEWRAIIGTTDLCFDTEGNVEF
jgi:hypothetical protein